MLPRTLQELRFWGLDGWFGFLRQAASHPLPMLSTGTPALSYWPIPYNPPVPKTTKIALLISKGMREPQTRSPRAGAGLRPVLQGQLLSSPASRSPGSPGSKDASGWEVAHSVHTLTHTGSPWAQAVTWHGSLVASRGCGSPLLPLISSGT